MPNATSRLKPIAAVAGLGLSVAYPLVVQNSYYRYVGVLTVMYIALSSGWNVMGGITGYVSLGHSAFFGLGAYFTGLTITELGLPHVPMMLLGGVFVALLAAGIGYVALRVRGASFVIVTIALVYITSLIAQGWRGFTGGSSGLSIPPIADLGRSQLHVVSYYLFLALAVAVIGLSWFIARSKFGMGLKAIREDEDKAEALGVATTAFKVTAFSLSAGLVGVGGGIYAAWFGFLDPIFVFSIIIGANMVLMALLGGIRSLWGPLLGALLIVPSTEYFLVQLGETQIHLVATGLLLGLVVLLMPDGIIPAVQRLLQRRQPPAASIREAPPAPAEVRA